MYVPKLYREQDLEVVMTFLRQNTFATIVTYDGQRPVATHTPVEVAMGEDRRLRVYGHFSGANPQRHSLPGQELLIIFQSAHTYISPRWYNHVNVSTWNYMIVHLYGQAREVQGEELHGLLSRLVQQHEENTPYRLEGLPQDFVEKEMKGVFGFAVEINRVEAGYKLSQNRSDEDYRNIIAELEQREDGDSKAIALSMRNQRQNPDGTAA